MFKYLLYKSGEEKPIKGFKSLDKAVEYVEKTDALLTWQKSKKYENLWEVLTLNGKFVVEKVL